MAITAQAAWMCCHRPTVQLNKPYLEKVARRIIGAGVSADWGKRAKNRGLGTAFAKAVNSACMALNAAELNTTVSNLYQVVDVSEAQLQTVWKKITEIVYEKEKREIKAC